MTLSYDEAVRRQRAATQRSMQNLYRARRDGALESYGGKCVICGRTEWASLQIVPRKGYRWGWETTGRPIRGGHEKMRWLEDNGYPDTHTLVCGPTFSECRKALQLID